MMKKILLISLLLTTLYSLEDKKQEVIPYQVYENVLTEASKESYLKGIESAHIFKEVTKKSFDAGERSGKALKNVLKDFFK